MAYAEITKEFVGGMRHLDDSKHSGGTVVTYPLVRGEKANAFNLGNEVPLIVRSKISNWRTYLNVNWPHSPKNISAIVGEIIGVDTDEFSHKEVLDLFDGLRKMPTEQLVSGVFATFNIERHTIKALRTIFMIWRHHLERLVLYFNKMRTAYIKKNKANAVLNDMDSLVASWKNVSRKNNIDSSSRLLLFVLPPKSMDELPGGSGKWPNHDKFHWDVPGLQNLVDDFLSSAFIYPGFCPKVPEERLSMLMKFPIDKLLKCINAMGGRINLDYCKLFSELKAPPVTRLKCKTHRLAQPKSGKYKDSDLRRIKDETDEFINFLKKNIDALGERESAITRLTISLVEIGHILNSHVYGKV